MQKKTAGESEGEVTGIIESKTAKIPSGVFLSAAVGSMAASAALKAAGKETGPNSSHIGRPHF